MSIKTTRLFITISLLLIIVFFASCEKGNISEDQAQIQYHRKAQLTNVYTNEIVPLNTSFILETTNLKAAVFAFSEASSISNLKISQDQWLKVLKVWKNLELYNLGTIEDTFIHFEINRWPTNTETINGFINGNANITETFIASNGSSSKGIAALEYLLFSSETNAETLLTFTTQANAERRVAYLIAVTDNLISKANQLQGLWTTFQPSFTTASETGLSGSQNQLANAMVTLSEQIVIRKLGTALGESNGGVIELEALENYRSNASLISITENVNALYNAYTGNYKHDIIKWGFNDYLDLIGAEILSNTIEDSFENCFDKINSISGTLKEALPTNPQTVIELQDALNALEVLIKVDMANAIGTTITVNSNDGD